MSDKLLKYYSKLQNTSQNDAKYDYYLRKIQYYLEGGVNQKQCRISSYDGKISTPCANKPNPWCNIADTGNNIPSRIYGKIDEIITLLKNKDIDIIKEIIKRFCKINDKCKNIFMKNATELDTPGNIRNKISGKSYKNFFISEQNNPCVKNILNSYKKMFNNPDTDIDINIANKILELFEHGSTTILNISNRERQTGDYLEIISKSEGEYIDLDLLSQPKQNIQLMQNMFITIPLTYFLSQLLDLYEQKSTYLDINPLNPQGSSRRSSTVSRRPSTVLRRPSTVSRSSNVEYLELSPLFDIGKKYFNMDTFEEYLINSYSNSMYNVKITDTNNNIRTDDISVQDMNKLSLKSE
jgi:hypothetical protein